MAWHKKWGFVIAFFLFYSGNVCRLFGHPFQVNVSSVQENGTVIGVVGKTRAGFLTKLQKQSSPDIYEMALKCHHPLSQTQRNTQNHFSLKPGIWNVDEADLHQCTFQRLSLGFGLSTPFSFLCMQVLHPTEGLQGLSRCCLLNFCKIKCNVWERPDTGMAWVCKLGFPVFCKEQVPLDIRNCLLWNTILFYFYVVLYCIVFIPFIKWF